MALGTPGMPLVDLVSSCSERRTGGHYTALLRARQERQAHIADCGYMAAQLEAKAVEATEEALVHAQEDSAERCAVGFPSATAHAGYTAVEMAAKAHSSVWAAYTLLASGMG